MHRILYPPRPSGRMQPIDLSMYEKSGKWIVQRKFNGTRTLIHVFGQHVCLQSRHGGPHKQFQLSSQLKKEILSLNLDSSLEYWLDGEILDAKTKNPQYKDKIVLFDVLQCGEYLFGAPNLLARYDILKDICRNPQELEPSLGIALKVSDNIWLSQNFNEKFVDRFKDFIRCDEIEGLVLKKKDSVIDNIGAKEYEITWQIRCRKPTKNYGF